MNGWFVNGMQGVRGSDTLSSTRHNASPATLGRIEGVDLEPGLLVGRGDVGIAEQVAHRPTVSQPPVVMR